LSESFLYPFDLFNFMYRAIMSKYIIIQICYAYLNKIKQPYALYTDIFNAALQPRSSYRWLKTPGWEGEMVFTIMASLAHFESALSGERIKAEIQRTRAQGRRVHRPPISEKKKKETAKLSSQGVSIKAISRQLKIAYATAHKYVKALQEQIGRVWTGIIPTSGHAISL
jgi:DNA-binding CsgD family transcriptional regulator